MCFALNQESKETMERPQDLLPFLHEFLHSYCGREDRGIGSNTMEAFALLVLVNNYNAWLYKEKKMHQCNLLTKYNCPPSYGKPSIVDRILDGVQFNLEMGASSPTMLHDKDDRTYKKLEKERIDWLQAFYKTDPCIQMNNDVFNKATSSTGSVEEGGDQVEEGDEEDTFFVKERARKTRKLTRGLCEFTGVPSEGERKCKG